MAQVLISVLAFLGGWLIPKLAGVFGTVMVSAGVIMPIVVYMQNMVLTRVNGLPAHAVTFLQFTGIPEAVSVIFAAYTMQLSVKLANVAFSRAGTR